MNFHTATTIAVFLSFEAWIYKIYTFQAILLNMFKQVTGKTQKTWWYHIIKKKYLKFWMFVSIYLSIWEFRQKTKDQNFLMRFFSLETTKG